MFRMQQEVAALDVPMCKPVEYGVCEDGVYTVQTWIDGDDAESVIPFLTDTEQYVYGLKAGCILRKIHSIPAPEMQEDWESRFNRKMDYKIQKYMECRSIMKMDRHSGNICFGMKKDGQRYFIKFAGAPTEQYRGAPADAVARLKATLPVYKDLKHKNLIELLEAKDLGDGFIMVFKWDAALSQEI